MQECERELAARVVKLLNLLRARSALTWGVAPCWGCVYTVSNRSRWHLEGRARPVVVRVVIVRKPGQAGSAEPSPPHSLHAVHMA